MSDLNSLEKYSIKEVLQLHIGEVAEDQISLTPKKCREITQIDSLSPADLKISLVHVAEGVLIIIQSLLSVNVVCSRCGKELISEFHGESEVDYSSGKEISEDQMPISKVLTVDLTQQIIDTIVPSVPLIPLCQQDCKGLCQFCGADLNNGPNHYDKFPNHKVTLDLDNHPKIG